MPTFKVYAERTIFIEADIEADDEQDAREQATSGHVDWESSDRGRGEGDVVVIDVEPISDDDDSDYQLGDDPTK